MKYAYKLSQNGHVVVIIDDDVQDGAFDISTVPEGAELDAAEDMAADGMIDVYIDGELYDLEPPLTRELF